MALNGSLQDFEKANFTEVSAEPGVPVKRVKVVNDVASPVQVALNTSTTATSSSIARSNTVQTALAANSSRKGFLLWNDTASVAIVKFGSGASTSDFSIKIPRDQGYEQPSGVLYTGIITVIWATAGSSSLIATEFT